VNFNTKSISIRDGQNYYKKGNLPTKGINNSQMVQDLKILLIK